jgi:hypothetical protein
MIKLQDLIKELERPSQIYAPGYKPEEEDDEFLKKGYKMSEPTIDPVTGASTSTVTYLPKLKQTRMELYQLRKNFMPFKYSSNPDIEKLAKTISTNITKLNNMILALEGMVEAEKQK